MKTGTPARSRSITIGVFIIALLLTGVLLSHAQAPEAARGVIRLKVKYKSGDVTRELARKRFFLIKGSLDENRSLVDASKQTTLTSRECYYRSKSASEQLIKWLDDNDCESVYCRAIEEREVTGADAVPEFRSAYDLALKELKTPEVARRWLVNYLPADLRDGYYNLRQQAIEGLLRQAGAAGAKSPVSIMTDRKGTAYLTALEPGTYTISNLVPSEAGKTTILWLCEREVKAGDLSIAMRRPFILSNEKDPKVKCEVIERPLPVCK